jgi:hypothetical protein
MSDNDYNYVMLPIDQIDLNVLAQCIQNSLEYCRKSTDGTLAIIKFRGSIPSFLTNKQTYSHEEIIAIMHSSIWNDDQL